ncbi:MAG TPA: HAMP domain-containing protein, partial [Planctomycetota bacterium]|nr:HAMP domain-containing protein [Planctomycetota bacterium]
MERRHGLGLRAQIVLGLLAAFAVAFSALGLIVMQLAKRSSDLSRARRAQTIATALAIALEERDPETDLTQGLARRLGGDDVAGIAVSRGTTSLLRIGELRGPPSASALLDRGELLQLWLMPGDPNTDTPLAGLLRLYLSVTGCVIAVLAYVLLTRLIVGPVESLTRAAEQLAEGARSATAPVGGAAEVARLAVTFNHMAAELRRQKGALEQRLAELEHTTLELSSTRDQLVRSEKLASVGRLAA